MKSRTGICVLSALCGLSAQVGAATVTFTDFTDISSLQLNGDAATAVTGDGTVLRVTPSLAGQAGSVFSKTKIQLAADASFSTYFSFRFSDPQNEGADGLVFVMQNVANNVGGSGGGIGYSGLDQSVGVEFDTWPNNDINANHVGININGDVTSTLANAVSVDAIGQMDQGDRFYSWIDYNGATDLLEVRLSVIPTRPAAAILSSTLDIPDILGGAGPDVTDAFIGFTSGTGSAYNNHDVIEWGFTGEFDPFEEADPQQPVTGVPDSGAGAAGAFAILSLLGVHASRRRSDAAAR